MRAGGVRSSEDRCFTCGKLLERDEFGVRQCAHPPRPEPVREDFLDFPTAWRLHDAVETHLSPRCSSVQTGGALLCDCGAVTAEWERRVAEQKAAR